MNFDSDALGRPHPSCCTKRNLQVYLFSDNVKDPYIESHAYLGCQCLFQETHIEGKLVLPHKYVHV